MKAALPLARQESLIVKEVDNETLIYDLETDQAHCLNETAALVWKNCDGKTGVSDIAQRLGSQVEENVVWLALDQLEKFNLLAKPVTKSSAYLGGMSRRQVVRALGVAAITLPLITAIVAPTRVQAASIVSCDCLNNNDCVARHGPGFCCFPHDACNALPSKKGCIADTNPPCKG